MLLTVASGFIMPEFGYIGAVAYEERFRLPWWWWAIGAALTVSIGVAVMAYVPWQVGTGIVVAFGVAVFAILFGYGNTRVVVTDQHLSVGRYRIERQYLAGAEAFTGAEAAQVSGPGADHRDLLVTRPYLPGLVRITLADPADPHPHWLISTRHPEAFARAVDAMAGTNV